MFKSMKEVALFRELLPSNYRYVYIEWECGRDRLCVCVCVCLCDAGEIFDVYDGEMHEFV